MLKTETKPYDEMYGHYTIDQSWGRRGLLTAIAGLGASALLVGCTNGRLSAFPDDPSNQAATTHRDTVLSSEAERKSAGLHDKIAQHRAAQVISTFENSTTDIQYAYAENLQDGRGITAGRAGFCSGTGDMLDVVELYNGSSPDNILSKYLKPLRTINKEFIRNNYMAVAKVDGLQGIIGDWKKAAETDKSFRDIQDMVVNKLYLKPAIQRAEALGIYSAVGQLVVFDTSIQHGLGDDLDGLSAILDEAQYAYPQNSAEVNKLEVILNVRLKHLLSPYDPSNKDKANRKIWRESADRTVHGLRDLLHANNPDLTKRMTWSVYGDLFILPAVS